MQNCNYVIFDDSGAVIGVGYTPDGTYPPGSEPATPDEIAALLPQPSSADLIKQKIATLEATVTPRRIREAVLGIDGGWLADLNEQIAALRAQLTV
tara:strand:- start:11494 stop:11781 length:288 start_codon:yes stop_codon:yes gene_type:complete